MRYNLAAALASLNISTVHTWTFTEDCHGIMTNTAQSRNNNGTNLTTQNHTGWDAISSSQLFTLRGNSFYRERYTPGNYTIIR